MGARYPGHTVRQAVAEEIDEEPVIAHAEFGPQRAIPKVSCAGGIVVVIGRVRRADVRRSRQEIGVAGRERIRLAGAPRTEAIPVLILRSPPS